MNPLFVHDPRRGGDLHSRFSLEGNPAIDKDWTTTTLEYVENGATKLIEVPLTPADFALTEGRFKKQFHPLKADAAGVPLHDYIDLGQADRIGKTPFVWSVDDEKKLVKIEVASTVVALVEERRSNWRTLQYLAGQDVARLDANHRLELERLRRQYEEAVKAGESSVDTVAQAMPEVAAASKTPPAGGLSLALGGAPAATAGPSAAPASTKGNGAAVSLAEEDVAKCTYCKTCYHELPELFERTRVFVNGATKQVCHLIPGALARVTITPELKSKIARVAADCVAEIIHEP